MQYIFRTLAIIVSTYSFLCFIRVILTWVPQLAYSRFTQFLAAIVDPYLNLFRGIRWLRMGSFDFSPAVGLCLLSVASNLLTNFSHMAHFSAGAILGMITGLLWSMISSIITFIIILFFVRLVIILIHRQDSIYGNPFMENIDRSIAPLVHNISKVFTAGKKITYKTALIISIVVLLAVQIGGGILFSWLVQLLSSLPF